MANRNPGSDGWPSPITIVAALRGVDFPASKQELIDHARRKNPDDLPHAIDALRHLPEQQYDSIAEVERVYGQLK